jgi:hypothetical protein
LHFVSAFSVMPDVPRILEGEKFGRWTLKEEGEPVYWKNNHGNRKPHARYWAQCDCGSPRKLVILRNVLSGHSQSCGCLRNEVAVAQITEYNRTRTRWMSGARINIKDFFAVPDVKSATHNEVKQ